MTQAQQDAPSISAPHQGTKKQKKQAKREAKIMFALEQAKRDVQRAEKKVATAQGKLENRQARVQGLETQLSAVREASNGASSEPVKEGESS